jgi:hypothetical protein
MALVEGVSPRKKSSTTAKVTPSPDCCSRCCRASTYRGRCCYEAASWPPPRPPRPGPSLNRPVGDNCSPRGSRLKLTVVRRIRGGQDHPA